MPGWLREVDVLLCHSDRLLIDVLTDRIWTVIKGSHEAHRLYLGCCAVASGGRAHLAGEPIAYRACERPSPDQLGD